MAEATVRATGRQPGKAAADQRMERTMARLLQTGVIGAASIVAIGGALHLLRHGGEPAAFRVFRPTPLTLSHPVALWAQLRAAGAGAVIDAGILVLVATPVCRVIFALVSFAAE